MLKKNINKKVENKKSCIANQIDEGLACDQFFKVKNFAEIQAKIDSIEKYTQDLMWARIWSDTIVDVEWLKERPGISPGRWAIGYNYIYILTRILNEIKPSRILDIGLGISSTLIAQYFIYYHPGAGSHLIIEQDAEWAGFYKRNHKLSDESEIVIRKCIQKDYNGVKYNAYDGFKEAVGKMKYGLISIDGPIGSEKYSRRDILEVIPNILEDSFVIIMDDTQREGEHRTVMGIKKLLKTKDIEFCYRYYRGQSDCCVIASADNRYLCSL